MKVTEIVTEELTPYQKRKTKSFPKYQGDAAPDNIQKPSDLWVSRKPGEPLGGTDFEAIRHNARLDGNEELQKVGVIELPNLFNPDHPDHQLELRWYAEMSPKTQQHVLKQHGKKSFR